MNNKTSFFKLYPNFIPIKGKYKCILADISKGEYFEIPKLVFEVLHINEMNFYNLIELNNYFNNKYTSGIQDYFDFFVKNRIGFYAETNKNLISSSYDYTSPFKVTNAILEVENNKNYCISTVIEALISIGCREIEIRILTYNTLIDILEILKTFQTSMVRSFYLICQSENENENLNNVLNSNPKINQLKIFNSNANVKGQKGKILYIAQPYIEDKGYTSLIINPVYFFESQKFNASLNQKISVDKEGKIKNYLSHEKAFGNVNNMKIDNILKDEDFIKIWNISNDKIETCKECQYRYFCLNFSELIQKNKKYFKKNYCENLFLN